MELAQTNTQSRVWNEGGILGWMHDKRITNEKGELLTFQDHMFLMDPYDDFTQNQVHKKCSQVGGSVMMNVKIPYMMEDQKINVIYTLPSDSDVWEFVPTKTDKIIQVNPAIKNLLGENKDRSDLKEIGDRFWYFKGTRSKTAAIMTTADLLVHDELDRSDQGVVQTFKSRTKRSKFKGRWELSNPSVKNFGVDVTWNRSDQKEWFVKCPTCELEQIINWHENIDYKQKIYMCKQCGGELDDITRRLGRWVAVNPDSEISGYHYSQMMAPWITAKELIEEEETSDEEYFYNFILGEPIGEGDAEDFRQMITDAWVPHDLTKGPQFMGVDIGSTKHYVIGNAQGIHTIGKLKTRQELEMLIEHWNPTVVMDAGPERTWAEEFRQKYPKLWICFYKRDKDRKKVIRWGKKEDNGIVYADRSRVIDRAVTNLVYAETELALEPKDLEAYIRHWGVMVKKKEINSLGVAEYKWDKNADHAQDHWVHATVYYDIARSKGTDIDYVPGASKAKGGEIVTQDAQGNMKMTNLKDYIEKKNR